MVQSWRVKGLRFSKESATGARQINLRFLRETKFFAEVTLLPQIDIRAFEKLVLVVELPAFKDMVPGASDSGRGCSGCCH